MANFSGPGSVREDHLVRQVWSDGGSIFTGLECTPVSGQTGRREISGQHQPPPAGPARTVSCRDPQAGVTNNNGETSDISYFHLLPHRDRQQQQPLPTFPEPVLFLQNQTKTE